MIQLSDDSDKLIYIPSLKLNFIGERTLLGKNWYETYKELQSNGKRMPTPLEFLEILKYVKENNPNIYKEITEVRNPWRANWLDADFKVKGKDLYINYNHILNSKGELIPNNSEFLDEDTLMKDNTLGISLEDYILNNHTSQGLPNKNVQPGELYYWFPRNDNDSTTWFSVDYTKPCLDCFRSPFTWGSGLGTFAVEDKLN